MSMRDDDEFALSCTRSKQIQNPEEYQRSVCNVGVLQ